MFSYVDVEGSELGFLKEKSLLNSDSENIFLMEICVYEHQPSGTRVNPFFVETFELMFHHQYRAYTADKYLRRVYLEEVKDIFESGTDTLLTHTFLFIKSTLSLGKLGL